jgi:hypothetical protein
MAFTLLSPTGTYDRRAIMFEAHRRVRATLAGIERAWAARWRVNDPTSFDRKSTFAAVLRQVWAEAKRERAATPDFSSEEYADSFEAWGAAYRRKAA